MKKTIFIMMLLLVPGGVVFALDRGQIRDQIRYLISDNNTDTGKRRWVDNILNERIEMAQTDIVSKSRCLEKTTYYTTYVSTREYALPADIITTERVCFWVANTSSVYKKMDRYTLFGLDDYSAYWQQLANGLPLKYYIFGNNIGLVPPVSGTYDGDNTLQIDYVYRPSSMTADSSIPFDGKSNLYDYHSLIIWYVVSVCKLDEGSYSEADYYEKKYWMYLQSMVMQLNNKPDWFPNFSFSNK